MYEIVAKIYDGNKLIKYVLMDINTGKSVRFTLDKVYKLAEYGEITNAEYSKVSNRIKGKNGCDLRKIKRIDEPRSNTSSIQLYTGDSLYELSNKTVGSFKTRDIFSDLIKYLEGKTNFRIYGLYGLRRTGKTVMMLQACKYIYENISKKIAYVSLTKKEPIYYVYSIVDKLVMNGVEYVFIDEITMSDDFINSSKKLADAYAFTGVHVIISGTESLSIKLASLDDLYGRIILSHTTYISFKEYAKLFPNYNIMDYIINGGILGVSKLYKNDAAHDYVSTSISDNINESIMKDRRRVYRFATELGERGLLKRIIEDLVTLTNNKVTIDRLALDYKNRDLGSAKQLIADSYPVGINETMIENTIRYILRIVKKFDANIGREYINEIMKILINMDVMVLYKRYENGKSVEVPLFNQPGIRYSQALALIDSIDMNKANIGVPDTVIELLKETIKKDVEDQLLESSVILSMIHRFDGTMTRVTQVFYEGKEIDMCIYNDKYINLYEIKRNEVINEHQYRWLINKEFNQYIKSMFMREIKDRFVLYNGEDRNINAGGFVIKYRNITNLLKTS